MKQSKFFNLSILLAFVATTLFANNNYPAPTDVVKQYFSNLDAGNLAAVEKLLAEDLLGNRPACPTSTAQRNVAGRGPRF